MMGLSAAVRWWEESQLRVLVLASTFFQFFLFCIAAWRMYRLPSWLRSYIWLAYLGSDATAIYALATLFNRHKLAPANGSILEVLWAPVLLIHLGGPITISAYGMEDNELWARHVLTLVSQVSVSLYVFCKSWPAGGERLLFQTAVLLFTVGIIKFSMKPWALKIASINSLVPTRETLYGRRKRFRFFDVLSFYWARYTSHAVFLGGSNALAPNEDIKEAVELERTVVISKIERENGVSVAEIRGKNYGATDEDISIQEYVREAKTCVEIHGMDITRLLSLLRRRMATFMTVFFGSWEEIMSTYMTAGMTGFYRSREEMVSTYRQPGPRLLGDSVIPYSERLKVLRSFLEVTEFQGVPRVLVFTLLRMFRILYTKEKLYSSEHGRNMWFVTLALSFAAIGLFAKAHKDGYSESDVTVTYILLFCNAALEVCQNLPTAIVSGLQRLLPLQGWLPKVAQQNMVSFVARRKRPTSRLMKLAGLIGFDDYVNKHWQVGHRASFDSIINLVLRQLEEGWKEYIQDAASFRRFNDRRGQWTLKRRRHRHIVQGCSNPAQAVLWGSLQLPFDESLAVWHVATDLCFYHPDAATPPPQESATASREISNYMAYLFFLHPEMLMPGVRKDVLIMACDDLELMFKYDDEPPLDERSLVQGIIHKQRQLPWVFSDIVSPLLPKAYKLAEALMEIRDVEERWKVIQGVWVEMLCYSASNCRGYLHAKSMGEGGEFISYVWLLLSYMGMETFADKFNRPNLFEDDDTAAAASDGASTSSSQQDGVPTAPEEITPATA